MRVDEKRLPVALLGVTLLWCLALALLGAHEGLLFLLPALLLAAPLAMGRYVGEAALRGLSRRSSRPRPARDLAWHPRPAFRHALRGARLLAASLAGRSPPPLAAVV
jgi:hypothetical protein